MPRWVMVDRRPGNRPGVEVWVGPVGVGLCWPPRPPAWNWGWWRSGDGIRMIDCTNGVAPVTRSASGTSASTIYVVPEVGFETREPPPLCEDCKEPMHPTVWLCGHCGVVEG